MDAMEQRIMQNMEMQNRKLLEEIKKLSITK